MKTTLFAAIVTAAFVTPATAQEFAGPRVEVHGGLDRLKILGDVDGEGSGAHKTGFEYGLGAGYDWRIANFVIGVEGGADLSTVKKCVSVDDEFETDRGCLKAGRDLEIGGRAGVVLGHALLYGKVAYANSRLRLGYNYSGVTPLIADDEGGTESDHYSTNRGGIRFGAGVQFAVTSHIYGKLEYRYTDYKKFRFIDEEDVARLSGNRNQLLGAVGFRF